MGAEVGEEVCYCSEENKLTRTILWSLTNKEMRVVSTKGSCGKKNIVARLCENNMKNLFLFYTYSKLLDESDEFAPG